MAIGRAKHEAEAGQSVTIDVNRFDPIPSLSEPDLYKRARYNKTMLERARTEGRTESAKMYEGRMNDCLEEISKRTSV